MDGRIPLDIFTTVIAAEARRTSHYVRRIAPPI